MTRSIAAALDAALGLLRRQLVTPSVTDGKLTAAPAGAKLKL